MEAAAEEDPEEVGGCVEDARRAGARDLAPPCGGPGRVRRGRRDGERGVWPACDPLRAAAGPGHQGVEGVEPPGRPRICPGGHRRAANTGADPRQAGGGSRGSEPRRQHGDPGRRVEGLPRRHRAPGCMARPRHRWQGRVPRRGAHAASAHRRIHRNRQERVPQRPAGVDPAARDARRAPPGDGRPEEGRAESLRGHPAPAHARGHEHEERHGGAGEHRARDGVALRDHGRGAGQEPEGLERHAPPAGPQRDPAHPGGHRRAG